MLTSLIRPEPPSKRQRRKSPISDSVNQHIREFFASGLHALADTFTSQDIGWVINLLLTCRFTASVMFDSLSVIFNIDTEQARALYYISIGRHVLITGAAGTGKSHLNRLVEDMFVGMNKKLDKTATTGTAAVSIGGQTIHSFTGMGINEQVHQSVIESWKNKELTSRLLQCERLSIDEISMLNDAQFDSVCRIFNTIRQPYGLPQIIMFGDFLQLPPISGQFAFQSRVWAQLEIKVVELKTVYRQKDEKWIRALSLLRMGRVTPDVKLLLSERVTNETAEDAVFLYSRRKPVLRKNESELRKIDSPEVVYTTALVSYRYRVPGTTRLMDGIVQWRVLRQWMERFSKYPYELRLKEGAKVLHCENNFPAGLWNGSVGYVVACEPRRILVQFTHLKDAVWIIASTSILKLKKDHTAIVNQFPLILAYAMTIHKAQGHEIDLLQTSLSKREMFQPGQGYVALSRAKTLDGLYLDAFDEDSISAHPAALKFYADERRERYASKF